MRSWAHYTLRELTSEQTETIVGKLATAAADRRLDPNPESAGAWRSTIAMFKQATEMILAELPMAEDWHLALEFEVPRRRRRVDAVLLARDLIFLFEVKAGARTFDRASKWQAEQYALDLRDFHAGSRDRVIVPMLVATSATNSEPLGAASAWNDVLAVQALTADDVWARIVSLWRRFSDEHRKPLTIDWEEQPYRPTPNIIEAACELYTTHDVREIASADAQNLDATVEAVVELVEQCSRDRRKGIAFITGAPGSGKTLAGLQVVHDPRLSVSNETAGVFLSGNMPLVEVISKALAVSGRASSTSRRRSNVRSVSTFIQHAYAFRNEYAEHPGRAPHEHVVLFDEAQRAWDAEQVSRWTRGLSTRSEPEILLDIMSRHDWAVVIAMVGGGQEINRGEAGIQEWGRALISRHSDWLVHASNEVLSDEPIRPGGRLFQSEPKTLDVIVDPRLNLLMNVRSPRAEKLNEWVDALLMLDVKHARACLPDPREFPLVLTRDLTEAKIWLRDRTAIDDRCGLVACSEARRLRAWGLDTKVLRTDRAWADWFLRPAGDVRSSLQLEVPATNFDCQGLELDWTGICWGNDLVPEAGSTNWRVRRFVGSTWQRANAEKAQYIINSYRVILTRSRLGQIIWVPKPDGSDPTLPPEDFDAVFDLLRSAGVQAL
jgi:hypothetical protein